jgi:hypothetical protein
MLRRACLWLLLSVCLVLALGFLTTAKVYAQAINGCPPFEAIRAHWAPYDLVYVTLASNIDPNTIVPQIVSGFQSWTSANQTNNSRVTFTFASLYPPACAKRMHVSYRPILDSNGNVDHQAVAMWSASNWNTSNNILLAGTVILNSDAHVYDENGNDTGSPWYDPSLPGYDTIFAKEIRHETGHSLALGHPDIELLGASVMNSTPWNCPNDGCGWKPSNITTCDNNAINSGYPTPVDPCQSDPVCCGDPCCDPCGGDPCCGDPCCGDPCCGDPCCGDPCCGDPCCGDPNCGQHCYWYCAATCGNNEDCCEEDPETHWCYVWCDELCCDWEQACY